MIAKSISNFSLALLLATSAWGGPIGDVLRNLESADPSRPETAIPALQNVLQIADKIGDFYLVDLAETELGTIAEGGEADLQVILVRLRKLSELEEPNNFPSNEVADRILSDPAYAYGKKADASNWIQRALAQVQDLFGLNCSRRTAEGLDVKPVGIDPTGVMRVLMYVLLLAGAIVIGWTVYRLVKSRQKKQRQKEARAKGLIEEHEESRTADEWLVLASRLEREGRYRESVRCLYLAILMRLDRARIARFDRTETNWEHLRRILKSEAPSNVPYRDVTLLFDLIWYGDQPASDRDCSQMRSAYETLMQSLREVA